MDSANLVMVSGLLSVSENSSCIHSNDRFSCGMSRWLWHLDGCLTSSQKLYTATKYPSITVMRSQSTGFATIDVSCASGSPHSGSGLSYRRHCSPMATQCWQPKLVGQGDVAWDLTNKMCLPELSCSITTLRWVKESRQASYGTQALATILPARKKSYDEWHWAPISQLRGDAFCGRPRKPCPLITHYFVIASYWSSILPRQLNWGSTRFSFYFEIIVDQDFLHCGRGKGTVAFHCSSMLLWWLPRWRVWYGFPMLTHFI